MIRYECKACGHADEKPDLVTWRCPACGVQHYRFSGQIGGISIAACSVDNRELDAARNAQVAPERALWEAMGCIADDEECLRMLTAHIASRVAAERERWSGLVAELLKTELGGIATTGSHAPVEDILGRLRDALEA